MQFLKVRAKNFLSYGENFVEFIINKHLTTMLVGANGRGKCVDPTTEIDIEFEDEETKKLYLEFMKTKEDLP